MIRAAWVSYFLPRVPVGISAEDLRAHEQRVSDTYAAAITNAHIQFVVNLRGKGEFN